MLRFALSCMEDRYDLWYYLIGYVRMWRATWAELPPAWSFVFVFCFFVFCGHNADWPVKWVHSFNPTKGGFLPSSSSSHHGAGGGQDAARCASRGPADPQRTFNGQNAHRRRQRRARGHAGASRSPGRQINLPAVPGGGGRTFGQLRGEQRCESGPWRRSHR